MPIRVGVQQVPHRWEPSNPATGIRKANEADAFAVRKVHDSRCEFNFSLYMDTVLLREAE